VAASTSSCPGLRFALVVLILLRLTIPSELFRDLSQNTLTNVHAHARLQVEVLKGCVDKLSRCVLCKRRETERKWKKGNAGVVVFTNCFCKVGM